MNDIFLLLMISQAACHPCIERQSTVILDADGECIAWYFDDTPSKLNPCENIPENAKQRWGEKGKGEQR